MKNSKYKMAIKMIMLLCIYSSSYTEGLGQKLLYFSDAVNLSDRVNSEEDESLPLMSSDGTKLLFARSNREKNKSSVSEIWYSKSDNEGKWQMAVKSEGSLNNASQNFVVGMTGNGTGLYVLNYKKKYANHYKLGISFLHNQEWSKPVKISKPKVSHLREMYVHPSEKIIVFSMKSETSYGEEDLYLCLKDSLGKWNEPVNLGATINSEGAEISPFLTEDGERLYFASNGHRGMGDMDIFYSYRLYGSWNVWSAPKNAGSKINSEKFDAYFSIASASDAYFVSNREGNSQDIYVTTITEINNAVKANNEEITKLINKEGTLSVLTDKEIQALLGTSVNNLIFFKKNSFTVAPEQRELLLYLSNQLKGIDNVKLVLVGHADNEGNEIYNMQLSEDRATEVKNLLISEGFQAENIEILPKGETEPLYRGTFEEARSRNRRVEIIILKRTL